ncbi:carboxylate--amine ligase [Streptomyces sp. 7N604]|uniref:carboxylate--amine ligase n=1 Tax=Streptomyces sp. 7N604 TaxID=3457415 RepID=UPI003FD154EC
MHHESAARPALSPMLDTGVPALLIRLDRNPFHHGTLGAVRSLGRAGIEVHTLVESPGSPVNRSRYVHRVHRWPSGDPSAARLSMALCQIAERIGRRAVLIPMDDVSAIAVAALAERLAGSFLMASQPSGLPERVADKAALADLCRSAGVPHPPTVIPGSAPEAAAAADELGLPLVAKWSRPWLLAGAAGLRSTTLVHTPDEARQLYERSGQARSPLLLQRHLPGGRGTDWFFHGCFGERSACLIGGTGRKELSWPVGTGLTAVGTWLPNAEVDASARRLAERLGYRGILDLDFRRDAATGSYCLLDFNPRPGAQFRLFADRAGLDVVRALHLDLTGRQVAAPQPLPGRIFVAENYALLSGLATAAAARQRSGARERRRARTGRLYRAPETAWFAADDPAPFAAMAAAWVGRGGRKGLRRLRPRPAAVAAP